MQLQVYPINVAAFTCSAKGKMFVVEASDPWMRHFPTMQPLYDDAADVGFALYNPATNVTTNWYWAEEERDKEGDLVVEIFKPTHETLRKHPKLQGWTIHILND